jgi:hypothetical protein
MGIGGTFYRLIGRRFSTLFLATVVGAFVVDHAVNTTVDNWWDWVSAYTIFTIMGFLLFYLIEIIALGQPWKAVEGHQAPVRGD